MKTINGELHIIWDVEDVLSRADDLGISCSEEQALNILTKIGDAHDCNFGVTWDNIDFHLEML